MPPRPNPSPELSVTQLPYISVFCHQEWIHTWWSSMVYKGQNFIEIYPSHKQYTSFWVLSIGQISVSQVVGKLTKPQTTFLNNYKTQSAPFSKSHLSLIFCCPSGQSSFVKKYERVRSKWCARLEILRARELGKICARLPAFTSSFCLPPAAPSIATFFDELKLWKTSFLLLSE